MPFVNESKTQTFPVASNCGETALITCVDPAAKSKSPRQSGGNPVRGLIGRDSLLGQSPIRSNGALLVGVIVRSTRTCIPSAVLMKCTLLPGANSGVMVSELFTLMLVR